MRRNTIAIVATALSGFVLGACQDLNVVNENLPDTERALQQPSAVEEVIKSSLPIFYGAATSNSQDIWGYYPIIANEFARTAVVRQFQPSAEPRVALKNDPLADEVWLPRSPWDRHNSGLANAIDGLHRIINDGLRIMTLNQGATQVTDNTDRARIWGKVLEGLHLGYCGLIMDQCPLYTHNDVLPKGYDDLVKWEVEHLRPYNEVVAGAIGVLEDAIADIDASPAFTLPANAAPVWVNGYTLTNLQVRQLANTIIARLLVYSARTPQERAAVNWQKVIAHTAEGLTYDFGPNLQSNITSSFYARLQGNTANDNIRPHYDLIGPADTSGAYQAWVQKPLEQRNRFDIATPDRRITGPTPTSAGAYFRYRADNLGFEGVARDVQFFRVPVVPERRILEYRTTAAVDRGREQPAEGRSVPAHRQPHRSRAPDQPEPEPAGPDRHDKPPGSAGGDGARSTAVDRLRTADEDRPVRDAARRADVRARHRAGRYRPVPRLDGSSRLRTAGEWNDPSHADSCPLPRVDGPAAVHLRWDRASGRGTVAARFAFVRSSVDVGALLRAPRLGQRLCAVS